MYTVNVMHLAVRWVSFYVYLMAVVYCLYTVGRICRYVLYSVCYCSFSPLPHLSHFQFAYSVHIQQASCVPTNTPATPPAFPDTLAAFAQLKASSPAEGSNMMQEPTIVHIQTQASKS